MINYMDTKESKTYLIELKSKGNNAVNITAHI